MALTNFEQIEQFQRAAGSKRPSTPTLPDPELLRFRHQLIREEYEEVTEAIETAVADILADDSVDASHVEARKVGHVVHLAHELADLLYVVYGTFSAMGVDADAVFAEVHRANMDKMGGPRRADGKLLKPANWQPADVASVVATQQSEEQSN